MGLKKHLITGVLWSAGGQVFSLAIVLITNIWLARLLSPKEFGQVGIIMFFITVANVLTEGGMSGALIRKTVTSKEDYSTVFVFNLLISVLLYVLLLFAAPFIAVFYKDGYLTRLLSIAGLVLIINAFQIVQFARLMSKQKFKHYAIYRVFSVLIPSAIGIFLAYQGAGVMALIIIQLLTALVMTLELWIFEGVFFSLKFNRSSFKELYGFGVNTTISSVLTTAFENIYQLILGKYFSLRQVGFYYQARRLQEIPGNIITMATQNVVFSMLSKIQDDKPKFNRVFNEIFISLTGLQALFTALIYLYAEPAIYYLFGAKWMESVMYMQLLVLATFFAQIELINRVVFKIFNATDKILNLELIKKGIQSLTIVVGIMTMSISILLKGFILSSVISYVLNHFYSRKILSSLDNKDLFKVGGLVLWAVLLVLSFEFANSWLAFSYLQKIITAPGFCLLFIIGVDIFSIVDIKQHFRKQLNKSI